MVKDFESTCATIQSVMVLGISLTRVSGKISFTGKLKKKKNIVLPSDIHERISKIYLCSHNGKKCLYLFIKTREQQPEICLHCLMELDKLKYFDTIRA